MSITKVGDRSPRRGRADEGRSASGGIPGTGRSPLFYQDRRRLPVVSHGEGVWLFDTEGRRYLDGCSGAICAGLGHRHPRLVEAARRQLDRVAFTYRLQFENEAANELAELLVQLSPPELDRVFFVNSGSEAVEAALKLVRQYWWAVGRPGKSLFVSRQPSYHGATLGALSVTGYPPLSIPYLPMLVWSPRVAAPFCYHCPLGHEYPGCEIRCATELERVLQIHGEDNVAAFIAEPIGGATSGAAVPPPEYFPIVERICHDHEVLLVIDDVMTGCGRTGTFYGYEHWDVTPDLVATSKGLSGGYTPLGAVIASSAIVEPVLESGGFLHGHTYAGNPLSAAIGLEAVRVVLEEGLVERAGELGTYLHERLHELKARHALIGDVRGRGLLAGVEFSRDRVRREPFPADWFVALEATEIARGHGLLVYPRRSLLGLSGDHVLIAPPLVVSRAELDELIDRFERTLVDLTALLGRWMSAAAPSLDDGTERRYEQPGGLPDYALGDLSEAAPVEAANITGAMETGPGAGFDAAAPDGVREGGA